MCNTITVTYFAYHLPCLLTRIESQPIYTEDDSDDSLIACFAFFQQPPEVIQAAIPFLWILQWSLLPLSLFFSCKQAAEAFEKTKYALWISLLGNGINALANPVMIFGTSFIPAFGYQGSAYATLGSRLIMGIAFMLILKPNWPQLIKTLQTSEFLKFKALYRCFLVPGWHTAWQVTFELTAFTAAGLMCGFLGKTALDAHGLVLSWASFSFMVAQGISTAGVVYVSGYLAQKKWKTMALYIKFQSRWVLFISGPHESRSPPNEDWHSKSRLRSCFASRRLRRPAVRYRRSFESRPGQSIHPSPT